MLFELKKLYRSKKILYISVFSLLITAFCFFLTPRDKLILQEESVNDQHYSIDNFFEGVGSPRSLSDKFFDMQQKYIIADDGLSPRDKIENNLNREKAFYKFLEDNRDEYPEIFEEKNRERLENIEWQIFKYENLLKKNSNDYYMHDNSVKSDVVKKFIETSSISLGLVPIIFFVIMFSDSYSREREDENLNLLYNQPLSRKRLIFNKFLTIPICLLMFIILSSAFFLFFALILKYPISGFDYMFRILGHSDILAYYSGIELVLYSMFGFFSLALFWSSLSFLLSTRFKSQSSLSIMLVILGFLFSATANATFMRNFLNPIYAQDMVCRLVGQFVLITKNSGETFEKLYAYIQPVKYLVYIAFSLLFLAISLNANYQIDSQARKERANSKMNIFSLELAKVFYSKSFVIYLVGILLYVSTNFASVHYLDKDVEKNNFGSNNSLNPYKSEYDMAKEDLSNVEAYLSGKKAYEGIDINTGKSVKLAVLDDETRQYLESEKKSLEENIRTLKTKDEEYNKYKEDYKNGNGKDYYAYLAKINSELWGRYTDQYLQNGKVINLSESKVYYNSLLKEASSKNVHPIILQGAQLSPLDPYKDISVNKELSRHLNIYTHSGPVFLYRLIIDGNFNLILLIVVSLMAFGAYSYDKEYGRQLEFLYTSSYSKEKIHTTKILAEFLVSLLIILMVMGYAFILGLISKGTIGINFPVASYSGLKYNFIALWKFLLKDILTLGSLALLLSSLINLLSIFIEKRSKLLISGFTLIFVMNFISKYLPASIRAFMPFIYFPGDTLADQSIGIYKSIGNVNYFMGLGVIIVWSIIFYIFGRVCLSNKKKQI